MEAVSAADIKPEPAPTCSECGEEMKYYGGSAGWICCGVKILYRGSGWFEDGVHVKDDRLAGGTRRVDGVVKERK